MVWAYGLVLFPVVLGSPLKYYWKGKCFQTEAVKRIIKMDTDHIVVETEKQVYCINYNMEEVATKKAAA